ncbi:hypothetical protein B0T14DRAFT_606849 [Immersiella caudata]|uniref:Uncharacterized protein n=1 Tax=Immersiella caudata TaxID=314043 RepID=A0AA39WFS7_9PEZI|nr:hypothetical protein B0T14DRAFT_606849 [Immersiella caudata]
MRIALCLSATTSVLLATLPQTSWADHSAEVQCYAPDGSLAPNDTVVPCNNLGITQSGIQSSCCQLQGNEDSRDLCTATGLCLNNGIVRRGYCTDKTFNNPHCVKVCDKPNAGGNPNGFAEMTSCTDGTYCCGRNNLTCCGTPWAIEPPTVVSSALTTTVTASASSSPSNTRTLAGLGAALGAVLFLALGATFYLLRRIQKLKSSLADSQPLLDRHSAELHNLRGMGMIGKSPLGSPSPSGHGTPKHMLAASPAMLPASAGGTGMQEAEFERLKGMYDSALLTQGQRRGSAPTAGVTGGGLDYLFRASELDGAGVQQRGLDARGNQVYEVPGQGLGRQAWNTSPGLSPMRNERMGRQQGGSMY